MGRGGTDLLWSSGFDLSEFPLSRQLTIREEVSFLFILGVAVSTNCSCILDLSIAYQGYRDKPYGQLVLVSLMHYCTSTPSLSTSWSRTTLQGAQGSGKSHLKASFPLRCFQRLSLPNLATRQCHWRDNRYTRGSSTPVLSY